MPSLKHAVISRVISRVRGSNHPVDDIPELRRLLAAENRLARDAPPRDVRRGHREQISNHHGFPVFTLREPDVRGSQDAPHPGRTLFYLHGGAYVRPTATWHWRWTTRTARALGAQTVMPIYPLAPEFTVEDSFEEMLDLFEEVAAESPRGVVLAGDSAGGGYALALAQALRDRGGAVPERMVLHAPWVDLTGNTPGTAEAADRDPWLSLPHLTVYGGFWTGSAEPEALAGPRVSPGLADLHALPPTLMFCGTRDLLQPGCDALFARAEEAEWSLEYVLAPGLIHVYPLLPIPEAQDAFARTVEFCASDREAARDQTP